MKELPRMVGFQAAGAAPIYENRVIEEPRTVATAIKIGNPANWGPALEAMKDSRGWIDVVSDEEILRAYRTLAREERSEEHTSELQSRLHLVCRLLLEKKKN